MRSRCLKSQPAPQMPTDGGKHIAESRLWLGIPGGLLKRDLAIRMEGMPQQNNQAVEPQQTGRTPFNRQVRPLTLRFDSQMSATLLVSDFDGPALDEVFHNLCCALGRIGRKVRPRFELALGVSREHPTNGQRIGACGIPESSARRDFQLAFG